MINNNDLRGGQTLQQAINVAKTKFRHLADKGWSVFVVDQPDGWNYFFGPAGSQKVGEVRNDIKHEDKNNHGITVAEITPDMLKETETNTHGFETSPHGGVMKVVEKPHGIYRKSRVVETKNGIKAHRVFKFKTDLGFNSGGYEVPYKTMDEALKAENAWLNEDVIKEGRGHFLKHKHKVGDKITVDGAAGTIESLATGMADNNTYPTYWVKFDNLHKDGKARHIAETSIDGDLLVGDKFEDRDGNHFVITEITADKIALKGAGGEKEIWRGDIMFYKRAADKKEEGGPITNQYEGKLDRDMWESWNEDQRTHFLSDHFTGITKDEVEEYASKNWHHLPKEIQIQVELHRYEGQYAKGGKLNATLTKYATQDINLLEKEGNSAITDTKLGVLWGEHKDGVFTFGNGQGQTHFTGNKQQAIEFVKNNYEVEEKESGGVLAKGGTFSKDDDAHFKNMPKHAAETMAKYYGNLKTLWQKGELKLTKDQQQELKTTQIYIYKYHPEFNKHLTTKADLIKDGISHLLDNYRSELEAMSDEEFVKYFAVAKGIDWEDLMPDMEDERDYRTDELIRHYKMVLKSRGEKLAHGGHHGKEEDLAKEFSRIIRRDIKPADLKRVIDRNKKYSDGACATHDFLDANMSMAEAFKNVVGRDLVFYDDEKPETEVQSEQDTILWDKAWALAKENEFYSKGAATPKKPALRFKNYLAPGTQIQSLVFDKALHAPEQAKAWTAKHKFKWVPLGIEETATQITARQKPKSKFDKASLQTIQLKDGVKALVGKMKSK